MIMIPSFYGRVQGYNVYFSTCLFQRRFRACKFYFFKTIFMLRGPAAAIKPLKLNLPVVDGIAGNPGSA